MNRAPAPTLIAAIGAADAASRRVTDPSVAFETRTAPNPARNALAPSAARNEQRPCWCSIDARVLPWHRKEFDSAEAAAASM
jgi:hypothetical protein